MVLDRPLVGEPLSLDLLNTTWIDRGSVRDLLEDLEGTQAWLGQAGLDGPLTEPSRLALTAAREAIRRHVDTPDHADACAALNEVLSWGHTRPVVGRDGPGSVSTVDDPNRRAGWLAAVNYVELLTGDPSRIRHCPHPGCVLYFYHPSPKPSRRWCSMAGCGNPAKAARQYARPRQGGS